MQSCLIANVRDRGYKLLLLVFSYARLIHFRPRFIAAVFKGFARCPFCVCIYPTAGCGVAARDFWPSCLRLENSLYPSLP